MFMIAKNGCAERFRASTLQMQLNKIAIRDAMVWTDLLTVDHE